MNEFKNFLDLLFTDIQCIMVKLPCLFVKISIFLIELLQKI